MLFSESDNNSSFSLDLHAQILADSLLDNNRAWIQYLQDHRQLIIKHSTTATINETVMGTCRYRIKKLLSDMGVNEDLVLTFKIINRIPNDLKFSEKYLESVYIPSHEYIVELRKMYVTLRNKVNKL